MAPKAKILIAKNDFLDHQIKNCALQHGHEIGSFMVKYCHHT